MSLRTNTSHVGVLYDIQTSKNLIEKIWERSRYNMSTHERLCFIHPDVHRTPSLESHIHVKPQPDRNTLV